MGEALITRRGGGGGYKVGDTIPLSALSGIYSTSSVYTSGSPIFDSGIYLTGNNSNDFTFLDDGGSIVITSDLNTPGTDTVYYILSTGALKQKITITNAGRSESVFAWNNWVMSCGYNANYKYNITVCAVENGALSKLYTKQISNDNLDRTNNTIMPLNNPGSFWVVSEYLGSSLTRYENGNLVITTSPISDSFETLISNPKTKEVYGITNGYTIYHYNENGTLISSFEMPVKSSLFRTKLIYYDDDYFIVADDYSGDTMQKFDWSFNRIFNVSGMKKPALVNSTQISGVGGYSYLYQLNLCTLDGIKKGSSSIGSYKYYDAIGYLPGVYALSDETDVTVTPSQWTLYSYSIDGYEVKEVIK